MSKRENALLLMLMGNTTHSKIRRGMMRVCGCSGSSKGAVSLGYCVTGIYIMLRTRPCQANPSRVPAWIEGPLSAAMGITSLVAVVAGAYSRKKATGNKSKPLPSTTTSNLPVYECLVCPSLILQHRSNRLPQDMLSGSMIDA